ncbi:diguanylate cyclase [Comamonas sp. NLF-1-9]|uniref:sensor domain-containing diguanylate cyclase n=1 Tax=Comamonas sp. NLF-1-9 TaxID=2853163 RepID=UPI001C489D64|nr:diguanylate cyclase [Comamonas sp. NLF-1-9]QXL85692.1 diguanylate cyclase [Comamonas sp. NLF-1-9]
MLAPSVQALEDPQGAYTLAQVMQPPLAGRFAAGLGKDEAFNFGITPSAWWFRFTLDNPGDEALTRVLEVAYPRLSQVTLYRPDADASVQTMETGMQAPFASRPLAWRAFAFPLKLGPQTQQTYYLRVQSLTAFIVPLRLWQPTAFARHVAGDSAAQAWYFGMASAMALFNLLIFLWLRERLFLYYVFFVVSMAFALAAQNGLVKQFLPLEPPWWSNLAATFGYSLAIATGLQFMRRLLDTARTLGPWDGALRALVWFFVLSPAVFPFTGQSLIRTAAVVYLLAIVVVAVVLVHGMLRRQRSAYFYSAAALMLAAGALVNVLRALGLLPTNVFTANAMQIGSALEMVLLALALADRYAQLRREKLAMQKDLLQAQTQLIEHLRESEQQLERKVLARTEELSRLNQQLAVLSVTDGLTGIANRRRFDELLQAEWLRARRSGTALGLAILDVDWFKAYNDRFGHPAGDACLRAIATLLRECVQREADLVARYGGEEFVMLMPGESAEGVRRSCERLRNRLQAQAMAHPGSPLGQVTLSVGIASMVPGTDEGPHQLLRRADVALYQAKKAGRDRVVVFEPHAV